MNTVKNISVWRVDNDVVNERERAHAKHGANSMRSLDPCDPARLAILTEEIGEVAKAFNEARHRRTPDDNDRHTLVLELRDELIQVAAMATDWAHSIDQLRLLVCDKCGWRKVLVADDDEREMDCPGCAGIEFSEFTIR